jgi:hypothetical protein
VSITLGFFWQIWRREHWFLASNSLQEAERLVSSHPNASALLITIDDRARLSQLVKETDIVIR